MAEALCRETKQGLGERLGWSGPLGFDYLT